MHVDRVDFTRGLYIHCTISSIGGHNTLSSVAEIPILNDFIPECTECFTCVVLRTKEDGLVLDCLNTIIVETENNDGDYCKTQQIDNYFNIGHSG